MECSPFDQPIVVAGMGRHAAGNADGSNRRSIRLAAASACLRAGIEPNSLRTNSTGLFVGAASGAPDLDADEVSAALRLDGPVHAVHTDSAAGLIALHLGARSVRSGTCSFALIAEVTAGDGQEAEVLLLADADLAARLDIEPLALLGDTSLTAAAPTTVEPEADPGIGALTEALPRAGEPDRALTWRGIRIELSAAPSARPAMREVRPVFVFPGHDPEAGATARRLLANVPVFAARFHECAQALAQHTGWSLTRALRGGPEVRRPGLERCLDFATQLAIAEFWRWRGVSPSAVLGHGGGEVAAACLAGALPLVEAARVVAAQAQAARLAAPGGVLVGLSTADAEELVAPWGGRLRVSQVDRPEQVRVHGDESELAELLGVCAAEGLWASREPGAARGALAGALDGLSPDPAALPMYSTVTGGELAGEELDAAYWQRNLTAEPRLAEAAGAALAAGHRLFVEMTGHPVLAEELRLAADAAGIAAEVIAPPAPQPVVATA